METKTRQRALFILLLLIFSLSIRLYWAIIIPPWQGPDEPTHYEYVHHLYQKNTFSPAQQWDQIELQRYILNSMSRHRTWIYIDSFTHPNREHFLGHYSQIGNSPPLYYSLNAFFLKILRPENIESGLFYSRIFNVLLGLLQLIVLFHFSRRYLFRDDSTAWPFYLLWLAFLPQYIFINSVVNNDNLAILIHFLFLWSIFSYHRHPDWKKFFAMIFLTITGLVTKRNLYFMALFIPVILIMTHKPRYRKLMWTGGIMISITIPAFLLYFLFSRVAFREVTELQNILSYLGRINMLPVRDFYPFLETLFSSYFFRAGWMNIHLPLRIHLGLILYVFTSFYWFCRYYQGKNKRLILLFALFFVFLIFISDFLNPYRGPQGRYLFPILPLFHYILFQGVLSRFSNFRSQYFNWSSAVWLIFFLVSSGTIWYHYFFKYTFIE